MGIQIRENSIAMHILMYLDAAEQLGTDLYKPRQALMRSLTGKPSSRMSALQRLMKSGFVEILEDNNVQLCKLTPEGELQLLLAKAHTPKPEKWDGRWRVVFFDIPEENKTERQQLRRLLLKNGFVKMQHSVYICPWPVNRDALKYLKDTGLIKFIRFGKMEELDDDVDLRKRFKLF
jgi:phenylacetic acid degradation operon negative regulatory protein